MHRGTLFSKSSFLFNVNSPGVQYCPIGISLGLTPMSNSTIVSDKFIKFTLAACKLLQFNESRGLF